jgi:hypothetical protein
MRIRSGFVSNSSSSSFIVKKKHLNAQQKKVIDNIHKVVKKVKPEYYDCDDWTVIENNIYYDFDTNMDNFDMMGFLTSLGITCANRYIPEAGDVSLVDVCADLDNDEEDYLPDVNDTCFFEGGGCCCSDDDYSCSSSDDCGSDDCEN